MEEIIINNRDFQVFLQPIVSTTTDSIVSAEALLRPKAKWKGKMNIQDIISYAEEEMFVDRIDKFVLVDICKLISKNRNLLKNIVFHVNISPVECDNENIADVFKDVTDSYNVPCNQIMLELLETRVMSRKGYLELQKLKDYGFLIGIDDYGTGHASVERYTDFDFDCVKISRELYNKSLVSFKSRNAYNYIISMAHDSGATIVQEGVETCSQYIKVKRTGIDLVQGYCISKAIPQGEFCRMIAGARNKIAV